MELRHVRQRYVADHISLDYEKGLIEQMRGQLQTSSRSKCDAFRLNDIGYSDAEMQPIAHIPHHLILQVSWDYDEIFEPVLGQMGQHVMDYRVRTQRKHWLRPGKRERTQTRSLPTGQNYGLQSSGEIEIDAYSRSSSVRSSGRPCIICLAAGFRVSAGYPPPLAGLEKSHGGKRKKRSCMRNAEIKFCQTRVSTC